MVRKIVVTSGKGGVGKTTLAVSLAVHLSKKGERVLVCDGDFGLNNADVLLGLEDEPCFDVVDVIEGKCRAKQALVRAKGNACLYLLPSNRSQPERFVSAQALKLVLDALSPQFDYILIDCPSGLADGFHRAVSVADEAIVVTTPQIISLRDADKTLSALKSYRLKSISLLLNRVRGEQVLNGDVPSPKQVAELLKTPLLAVVPELPELYSSVCFENRAFSQAAKNLRTGERKLYDTTRRYRGLIGGLRRALKEL